MTNETNANVTVMRECEKDLTFAAVDNDHFTINTHAFFSLKK